MDGLLLSDLAADLDATFERLVVGHQDRLYTIALRLLGDPRDAEEVAQDALVRAYRALASYEPERIRDLQLRPWLATIAINLCRNHVRRKRPVLVALEPLAGTTSDRAHSGVASALTEPAGGPLETAVRRDSAAHWAALLMSLPPLYRTPIVLRHVDGLSYQEMSSVLGRPEGTLKAQVHRGLALLRDAYLRSRDLDRQELTA